jgi:hypothetical protein
MDSDEQRSALRAGVYRGDGRAVVDLLGGVVADDDSLQLAGDGVIAAVMQRVDGAAELREAEGVLQSLLFRVSQKDRKVSKSPGKVLTRTPSPSSRSESWSSC